MKKEILAKAAGILAGVALLSGATFAYFTSNAVTITGVSVTSATPSLKVYDGANYVDSADLGISESNMYPGWVGSEHTFYLKNETGGTVPFGSIIANLPTASGSWGDLKDVVKMRFGETGTGWSTSYYTLNQWNSGSENVLLSNLPAGTERLFSVQFAMDSSAGDTAKNKNIVLNLGFVGRTP